MLNALLVCALVVAQRDTAPVVLAGAPSGGNAFSALAPVIVASPLKTVIADSLVLDKSDRELTLYFRGQPVKRYSVALGKSPVGDKIGRGDGRTPEGVFYIESRNAQSKFHLALRISYPDAAHRAKAARYGVAAGGDIMIHGLPTAFASVGALHRQQDWTEGCVAVTNDEIEEIWRAVPNGARILIKP
jgi:murein L,D-transpeptidase YafK